MASEARFIDDLEHLAPATQPTPPSVRYPGGAGPDKDPRRFLSTRPTRDAGPFIRHWISILQGIS